MQYARRKVKDGAVAKDAMGCVRRQNQNGFRAVAVRLSYASVVHEGRGIPSWLCPSECHPDSLSHFREKPHFLQYRGQPCLFVIRCEHA